MPVMEVKILPLGTPTTSVSEYVAKVIRLLEDQSIRYQLTAVGTIVEHPSLDRLLAIAGIMHKTILADVNRVVTFIEIDDRKDKPLTMAGKVESVCRKMEGREPSV